jgi:hypothetical protein
VSPPETRDRAATRDVGTTPGHPLLLLVGSVAVLVSGYVHYYLYFKGGYRDIAPDSVAGLTISRAFAINAIAGPVIAWAIVVSLRVPKLSVPAALAGFGFAAATLAAYLITRTVGLLGFEDNQLTWEAVLAFASEVVALASLGSWLVLQATHLRASSPATA